MLGSLGSILESQGSLEHNSKGFRATNLKLGTDTWLGSGKMPIDFGVSGVKFGVTECKKVKIAPMGISCPALWCYISEFWRPIQGNWFAPRMGVCCIPGQLIWLDKFANIWCYAGFEPNISPGARIQKNNPQEENPHSFSARRAENYIFHFLELLSQMWAHTSVQYTKHHHMSMVSLC